MCRPNSAVCRPGAVFLVNRIFNAVVLNEVPAKNLWVPGRNAKVFSLTIRCTNNNDQHFD